MPPSSGLCAPKAVFNLNGNNRFAMSRTPIDLRKGVDSLCGAIRSCRPDSLNGDVYVFSNRNRTVLRLLHWERGDYALYYKRLAMGRFHPKFTEYSQFADYLPHKPEQIQKKPLQSLGTVFTYKRIVDLFCLGFFSSSFSGRSLNCRSRLGSSALLGRTASTSSFLGSLILSHVLVVINEFDEAHFSIVTQTVTSLDDTSVTARTVCNLHRDFLKQFSYSILVLQIAKYHTTGVCSVVL